MLFASFLPLPPAENCLIFIKTSSTSIIVFPRALIKINIMLKTYHDNFIRFLVYSGRSVNRS